MVPYKYDMKTIITSTSQTNRKEAQTKKTINKQNINTKPQWSASANVINMRLIRKIYP
jgi:hypothetical protein